MEETEMKKRKTRIRWGRVCVAGIILMLVLKLLASFVMTAFEKRYEELGFGESAEETGTFITKPEKLPQNQVNAKLKKNNTNFHSSTSSQYMQLFRHLRHSKNHLHHYTNPMN